MVRFEDALKEESDNPKSKGFVTPAKISLNYKLISAIAPLQNLLFLEPYK